jgi:hypothetical protein
VASVLARLRNVATNSEQSFNDILQAYVIERFLARLARSPEADTVLLKGALMLRVWGVPRARPTMDIDFLRRGIADRAVLVQFVEQCAAIEDPSDGVIFEPSTISVESIRDTTEYVVPVFACRRGLPTFDRPYRLTLASAMPYIRNRGLLSIRCC